MEEKNEERRNAEQQVFRSNRSQIAQTFSCQLGDNDNKTSSFRRGVTISFIEDEDNGHKPKKRQSVASITPMKTTVSSKKSAHSSANKEQASNNDEDDDEENSDHPFRTIAKKLQHARSHGELFPPRPSGLPSTRKSIDNESIMKHGKRHSVDMRQSPREFRPRSMTATEPPKKQETDGEASSSRKTSILSRIRNKFAPSKRIEDRQSPTSKVPNLNIKDISTNDTDRTVPDSPVNHKHYSLQNPIKLNELRTWFISKSFPEQRIKDEFEKLPTEALYPQTIGNRPENKAKNRFNFIEPYDHSRVVLDRLSNDPSSDYINASFIDGSRKNKLYIAAQAPTDTTLYDFIRMIWQLRIESIIMLTRLFEDGKRKCNQYWPDEGEKRVNNFLIRIENEENYSNYTIRRFTLYNQHEPKNVLLTTQYHFLSWPDHDCLPLSTPLLDFRQRFRLEYKKSNHILVHCSAGIGRSGTFIALDALLETAEREDTIDVLEFTFRMRKNRGYMIQTVAQYVFLYRTLIEGILTMNISVSIQDFLSIRRLYVDPKSQYKLLEQLQSTVELSYHSARDPSNVNKNRDERILAPDNNRPFLMTQVERTTDYINAVFVNSYRQTPRFIVTQYPLPHTCIDFWRLVYDHQVSIIMLLETIIFDSKTIPYWPTSNGQILSYGPFQISLGSQKEDEQLIERVFEIKLTNKNYADRTRTVRQFQIKDNANKLFIIKRFLKEMRTYHENNLILQCLNGVTVSGNFAALCNSIDKMQTESIVDLFKVVRLLRSVRPEFINQEQYENLYLGLRDYAQQYLMAPSPQQNNGNFFYMNTPGQNGSPQNNRVVQRL